MRVVPRHNTGRVREFDVGLQDCAQQEQALDDLGVEQTMRVDQSGLIEALSKGMLDIMKSMHHYLLLQQEDNFMYNDQQQHKDCRG